MGKGPRKRPRRRQRDALKAGLPLGMKPSDFMAAHPVFRREEFIEAHRREGRSPATSVTLLRYHVGVGRIRSLRRGLYGTAGPVDPWLLGSRLAPDAVLAYDGALSFHGLSGLGYSISFLTEERATGFEFNEVVYTPVKLSRHLRGWNLSDSIVTGERGGLPVRATSRDRTLVDLLDRLDLAPSFEELSRCFRVVGGLDASWMVGYAKRLGNRLAAMRLGYFLEGRQDTPASALQKLERLRPSSPAYFHRREQGAGGRFHARWNLVVPEKLADDGLWPRLPREDDER